MDTKVKNSKILKIIVCIFVFLIGLIFLNNSSYAATETVDGITWTYTLSGGYATNVYTATSITTSLLTDGTTLVVPDTLGGYAVKSVGKNSSTYNIINKNYSSSNANRTIQKIVLPTTVTTINQYAFSRLYILTEVEGLENVTSIGNYAFYYAKALPNMELPSKLTTIGNFAFRYCSSLTYVQFNSAVSSLGSNLFHNCTKLTTLDFNNYNVTIGASSFSSSPALTTLLNWDNVTTIGEKSFTYCTTLTNLTLPKNLTKIGVEAFKGCTNLTGDLIIPENVTIIGKEAFYNCKNLNGKIEYKTTKIVSIANGLFYNCVNVKKVIIPNSIKNVGSDSFYGFKDVWVDCNESDSNIWFASNFSGANTAYVHYLDDKHTVKAELLPGIKLTDLNTGSDFVSGEFPDGTNINVQFTLKDGYDYEDVIVLVEKDGTYKNGAKEYQKLDLSTSPVYTDSNLLRNTKFITLNISKGLDLVARTYIDSISKKTLETTREPQFQLENSLTQYKHTKYPLIVETGDIVLYKIRIYNEGDTAGTANKIVEHLPTGLDYYADSKINSTYGWTLSEDGRTVTTEYTKSTELPAYTGMAAPSYVELEIECIVSQEKGKEKTIRLTNFVEIAEASSADADSIPGNINIQDSENYKKEEAENSNSGSYIQGEEDDQDFENVLVLRSVPVSYVLKISKVDSEDFQLLNGAKFDLINQNGEVLQSGVTVQNGELVFDRITTYDGGTDIYYISEVETPVGYTNPLEQTIKITVVKTIVDEVTESYALEIICDLLETRVDTTVDEDALVPIYTKDQLKKVGSEEEIEINGITYKLGVDNNYRLMENIDISGEEWIPLPNITGVFDGNDKTITGLTITDKTLKEIGLFAKFSGVIDSLTLDKVSINIDLSSELEELEEKYADDPEELATQIEALISPYHIGGLVGTMTGGSIINTTVNGTIYSDSNNVGGFVGYGENGYLTKIKNSTNNANVTTSHSNAGGFVGYSYSALSIVDCTNNGKIIAGEYNAAGLVGYSEAKDYETSVVKTEFDSQNSIVNLIIGNNKYVGHYSLVLNKLDAGNKQLIDGTKFTVYDENKAVINGLESVEVKNGVLNIGQIEVKTTGVDTYFLKEIEAAKGYDIIDDYIRIDVIKTWDGANSRFKFSTDSSNVTVDGFISTEFISKDEDAFAGAIYNYKQIDTVKWLVNKVVALSCTNNGEITAGGNAAGIFAKTNCSIDIENSTNAGKITAQNHTAGLLSESLKIDDDTSITINNSKNKGEIILSAGSLLPVCPNAAGILADTQAYTIIKNTNNEGTISGTASSSPTYAGIVGNVQEDILIDTCKNTGKVTSQGSSDIAAGILGKIIVPDTIPDIINSENTADITATYLAAGILGQAGGDEIRLKNTGVNNCFISANQVVAGIVGFSSTDSIITNCKAENIILNTSSGAAAAILALETPVTYTLGEIGSTYQYKSVPSLVEIKNTTVKNMSLTGNAEDKAALVGKIIGDSSSSIENVKFIDCTVEGSNILTEAAMGHAGMLAGTIQGHQNLDILRCNIKESKINQGYDSNYGSSSDTGMMIGFLKSGTTTEDSSVSIIDSNVENCEIKLAGAGNVSNMIGYNSTTAKTTTTVRNSNVKSSPIETKGTGEQRAGNIFAVIIDSNELIVDNCDIIDSPITTKTTYSMSNTASVIGMNYNNRFEFTNLDVTNSTISACAGTIGILAADVYTGTYASGVTYEGIIENCNITDTSANGQNTEATNITGTTNAGAIAGLNRLGNLYVKNVNLKSTKEDADFIFGTNSASTGVGYSGSPLYFDNFNVDNYQYKAGTTSTYVSGVVSILSNNLEIKNSSLTNLKFNTTSSSAAISGYNSGTLTIDNTTVKNIEMKTEQRGFTAGLANIVNGTLKLTNSTIDNIVINSNTSDLRVSGLIAYIGGNNSEISNCKISNIDVTANGNRLDSASGVIGIANNTLVFANNELNDITVKGNAANVSGIVSIGKIDTVGTYENSKTTLNNITLSSDYTSNVNIGSVLAVSSDSSSKIENVTANNVKISTSSQFPRLGGLVGCAYGAVNNCKVTNSNIESTDTTYSQYYYPVVGGMYGLNSSSANNHSNLIVQGTTVKTNVGYAGGIYGLCQANVTNATLTNSNVIATGASSVVGGIIGHDGYNLTITDSSVLDSKISNVGQAVTEISSDPVTIFPAGGILGFARGLVKDCEVIRTTVESTATDAYATGGIVGHGYNTSTTTHTVVEGCNVIDSTITGANGLGGIAGAAVPEITNCTVQGTQTMTNTLSAEAPSVSTIVNSNSVSNPTVEEVVEESVAEEVTEEAVVEAVTEEPVAEEVTEEAVVEEVAEDPVVEEVAEEPVVEEVAEELVAEEVTEDPVTEEVVEEPVTEEVVEEPVAEEVTEDPVAEEVAEDPVAEDVAEEPVVEEVTEDPVAEDVAEKPVVEEVTEEPVAEESIVEEIIEQQVEDMIKTDNLLNATISSNETIIPNTFATDLLTNEIQNKSKISGTNYVGGILGHGGVILDTYAQLTINKCTVKDTTIEGKTDVHEDVGVLPSYPATYVPTVELLNSIIDFVKENVILNILGEDV